MVPGPLQTASVGLTSPVKEDRKKSTALIASRGVSNRNGLELLHYSPSLQESEVTIHREARFWSLRVKVGLIPITEYE